MRPYNKEKVFANIQDLDLFRRAYNMEKEYLPTFKMANIKILIRDFKIRILKSMRSCHLLDEKIKKEHNRSFMGI